MKKSPKSQSAIQKIYQKYEGMADKYASKIFNYERYGYEKEDVIQEFRIKIYTSIISYSEKWEEYKKTNKYKPVPLEFYLKTAMVNKVKDFIKLFNMELVDNVDKISIQNDGFDYSESNDIVSVMSLDDNICEINGVNIYIGLIGRRKQIFTEFVSGYNIREIQNKYPMFDVEFIINNQLEVLKQFKEQLFDYNKQTYVMTSFQED